MSALHRRHDDITVVSDEGAEPRYLRDARKRVDAANRAFAEMRAAALTGGVNRAAYAEAQAEIELADLNLEGMIARQKAEQDQAAQAEVDAIRDRIDGPELRDARARVLLEWEAVTARLDELFEAVEAAQALGAEMAADLQRALGVSFTDYLNPPPPGSIPPALQGYVSRWDDRHRDLVVGQLVREVGKAAGKVSGTAWYDVLSKYDPRSGTRSAPWSQDRSETFETRYGAPEGSSEHDL
ncbi:MAG: hypothetical protein PIR53_02695 [Nocardioides alkalitolerans]